jgi:hypothetical protein
MGLEQWYISQVIKGLSKEEKQAMVKAITDEFIMSMSPPDRKELVKIVLPDMVERLMTGMTLSDRKELVEMIMPLMIAQMGTTEVAAHDKKVTKAPVEEAKGKHE